MALTCLMTSVQRAHLRVAGKYKPINGNCFASKTLNGGKYKPIKIKCGAGVLLNRGKT